MKKIPTMFERDWNGDRSRVVNQVHPGCEWVLAGEGVATRKLDGQVELTVADNGKGIAPEIRERIFEPFFTTKDEWSNVGLGLSVSFRIVEEHGGRIAVESQPGSGSTFTVSVPA